MNTDKPKRIPISSAKRIAKDYNYDQVVILARRVGDISWTTTYGVNKEHCQIAARMGEALGDLESGKCKLTYEVKKASDVS